MNRILHSQRRWFATGVIVLGLATTLSSCGPAKTDEQKEAKERERGRTEDAVIEMAYQAARKTIHDFIVELGTTRSDYRYLVKMRVDEGGVSEYVWVEPVSYQSGFFRGPVANAPTKITSVGKGDILRAGEQDIFDWVILDYADKRIAGGFTQQIVDRQRAKRRP